MTVHWGYNRCPPKELLENNPDHPGGYCCMQWDEVRQEWLLVEEDSNIEADFRAPNPAEIRAEIRLMFGKDLDRYLRHGERILIHCIHEPRITSTG
jgi:hypothetical protein